jgi:hypothetical protein
VSDSNFDIWRLQSNSDVRGLLEAVRLATPDVRKRAVTALRALGATSAIPGLQAILVEEKDAEVRALLISTLDYLFQQEMDDDDEQSEEHSRVVQLIAQLNSDKPEQIIRAAQNLAELKEKIAVESLIMVFHNRHLLADVRLAAAEALIKLESAPVEISLLGALRHHDWHHRRNAAAVLGQLSADWAVRPLAAALRDEQEIVRRTAHAALKRIGTPAALKAIEPPQTVTVPPAVTAPASPILAAAEIAPSTPAPEPTASQLAVTLPAVVVPQPPPTVATESVVVTPELPQPPLTASTVVESAPAVSPLEAVAPVDDDDTQPSPPAVLPDDVS